MLQEFTQKMKRLINDKISEMHTMIPGEIVSFDPSRCEATVKPLGKHRKPDGKMLDFPLIHGVPVYFPQGGSQRVAIVYPVSPKDECLLLFGEQTLETWKMGAESKTDLRFDLQNCVAIVGLFAKAHPLVAVAASENAVIIANDEVALSVTDNQVTVKCGSGELSVSDSGITAKYGGGELSVSGSGIAVTGTLLINGRRPRLEGDCPNCPV